MTPSVETSLLVVLAIVVLLLVCLAFGCFKPKTKEENPVETPVTPATTAGVFHKAEPIKSTANTTYEITNAWFQYKDGDHYQLIKSSSGAMFFVVNGKRVYLSQAQKNELLNK